MTKLFSKYSFLFFWIISVSVIMSSCLTTASFLEDNETLLKKNEIEVSSVEHIENKKKFVSTLNNLIQQKPNGSFLGIPKEYIYHENNGFEDTLWNNRFLKKYLGERPTIVNQQSTKASAQAIENYLINKKGFYRAKVDYQLDTIWGPPVVKYITTPENRYKSGAAYTLDTIQTSESIVTYNVNTGPRYKINSISYLSSDKNVLKYINSIKDESIVKAGDYIDATTFDLELTRMSLALQNKGYANFATNYFNIQGDSTVNNHGVDIFLEIRAPLPDTVHQEYIIGSINVFTDYHRDQDTDRLISSKYNTSTYYRQANEFLVKPSTIDNAIFLKPGSSYNRDARSKTRKKLSELGTYRFVTLNAKVDEVNDSIINYDIVLTPFQKKWVADFGWDFFISSTSQTSNGSNRVFGLSLNNQLKNRNFLGGAEQFTLSTEVGLELQVDSISSNSFVRSRNFGLNAAMEIPRQRNLLGFTPFLRSFRLMNKESYQSFKENTKTTVGLGYAFNELVDNFSRSSINANYSYDYRPDKTSRFVIRQLGLDYNDYELFPEFEERIEDNPLLLRSFDDNLLTGLFFRDVTYFYSSNISEQGNSFAFIGNLEISGWEKFFINSLYNVVTGNKSDWRLNNNIEFSKYIRLDIDPRFYKYFNDRHSLAARAYAGFILPFGGSEAAPYLKQFSVGGPNSLRGWDQKELGPGEYSELLLSPIPNQNFFQTGDIKLEANVEYRFDIFYIFEGALFMDVGNVWTLKANQERPGSQITSNFLDQLAVSAGYGIRFDFDYFNIRFDFGYKLRNPFTFDNSDRHWYNWNEIKNQKFGNFQVAVNYPF